MNWDAIGAVGEVVGAIAVLVTLVYLALQIRIQNQQLEIQNKQAELQNTEARLASNQKYLQSVADIQISFAHDAELVKIYIDLMTSDDWESLDPVSIRRIYFIWAASFRIWEGAYHRRLKNQFDEGVWQSIERANEEVFALPSFAEWWSRRYVQYSDNFAQYIDNLLKGQTSATFSNAE